MTKKYISLEHAIRQAVTEQNYKNKSIDESISPVDYDKPKEVPQAFFKQVHIEPRTGSEQIQTTGPVRSRRNVEKEKSSETMHPNLKEESPARDLETSRYRRNTPSAGPGDGRSNAEKMRNVGRGILQSLTGGAERKSEDVADMADAAYQSALRRARTPEARKALEDARKKSQEQRGRIGAETEQELERQREAQKKALETPEGAGAKIATDVVQLGLLAKGAYNVAKEVKGAFFPKAAPGAKTPVKAAKGQEEIKKGSETETPTTANDNATTIPQLPASRPRAVTAQGSTGRSSSVARPNIRYNAGRGPRVETPPSAPTAPTGGGGGGGGARKPVTPDTIEAQPSIQPRDAVPSSGPRASADSNVTQLKPFETQPAGPSIELRGGGAQPKPEPQPAAPPRRTPSPTRRDRPAVRPTNPDKIPQPLRRIVPEKPADTPSVPGPTKTPADKPPVVVPSQPTRVPEPNKPVVTPPAKIPGAPAVTPVIPKPAETPATRPAETPAQSPATTPQRGPQEAPSQTPSERTRPETETPGQPNLPAQQPKAVPAPGAVVPVPAPSPRTQTPPPPTATPPASRPSGGRGKPEEGAKGKGKGRGRKPFFPFGGGAEETPGTSGGGTLQIGGSARWAIYPSGASMKEEKELSRYNIKSVARPEDKREEPIVPRPNSDRNKTMSRLAQLVHKVYEEKKVLVTIDKKKKEEGLGKNPLVNLEPELKHNQLDQGS